MKEIRNISQLIEALKMKEKEKGKVDVIKLLPDDVYKQKKEERHFCIALAGHIIAIDSLYSEVYSICRDYLSEQEPEIRISICDSDIEYEYSTAESKETSNSTSYMETLAVYRKISEAMLQYDTFLMHGAVVAVKDAAYMFTAKSGTGKTTHINKWINNLDNAFVVNGDKPLIKITDTEVIACGTPWCGKEHMANNIMVPLKAIVFMERSENNVIKEITYNEAFAKLIQQTYRPRTSEQMKKTIHLLSALKGKVKFFLYCFNNMKEDAFEISYRELTGNNT